MKTRARVFISYSSRDLSIARQLHDRLRSAGFAVWRDERSIETDWSTEIAHALAERSDVVCLIWGKDAAESKWVRHEWLTARALEKLILPCILPGGSDLPEPLKNLAPIWFREEENSDQHLEHVVERLQRLDATTLRYDYSILPKNCFIPFNPNPEFTGRSTDLLDLYLKMVGNLNKIGLNQVGTTGMGGVGKTQLAVEFAYRYAFGFSGIFWVQAAESSAWGHELVKLIRDRLGHKISDPNAPGANSEYLHALQRYCKKHANTLLIFDNVDDPSLLNSEHPLFETGLTVLTLGCDLLFTTRRQFDLPGVSSQHVDVLNTSAAFEFLTAHRKPTTDSERDDALAICSAVGYLPLALVLIAGFINKRPQVTFGKYLADLRQRGLDSIDRSKVPEAALATRHKAAVKVTLQSQWNLIKRNEQKLLKVASLFPETTIIPRARLRLVSGFALRDESILEDPAEEALLLLFELNLVETLGQQHDAIRLHPLIRDFAYRKIPKGKRVTFKLEAGRQVLGAYNDPIFLRDQIAARGIDDVIEDLAFAISLCQGQGGPEQELRLLMRLLDRERHHLKANDGMVTARYLVQLQHRAQTMALTARASLLAAAFDSRARSQYRTVWVSQIEDPAWIRRLKAHQNEIQGLGFIKEARIAVSSSWDLQLLIWNVETIFIRTISANWTRRARLPASVPIRQRL
jgi:hypothetical protein